MTDELASESFLERLYIRLGLKEARKSRRHLSDYLFKILLGILMIIIISPFFLVLIQVASIGFVQVFGTGPGQGTEFPPQVRHRRST